MADNDLPYWKQTLVAAPVFGAKALIGDLPKGAVEHAVERKVEGSPHPWGKLLREGVVGRGGGRAIGGALGILTAPMYIQGLRMAASKDTSERNKGIGLLGLSSTILATQKGAFEGYRHSRVEGLSHLESAAKGLGLGLVRSGYKLPAALAVGMGVAAGRHHSEEHKSSPVTKFVMPAVTGAGVGALGRGVEHLSAHLATHGRAGLTDGLRKALPAAAGGAAGGAIGGLVLAGVVEQATRMLGEKKHASAAEDDMTTKTAGIPISTYALHLLSEVPGIGATHQAYKGMLGFGHPGRLFAKTPGLRGLQHVTHDAEARHMAIGIREGLAGKADVGWRSALSLGSTMPEMLVQRRAGHALGRVLRALPPERRATALEWMQRKVAERPHLLRTPTGDSTPIFGTFSDAVDRAVGKKSMYRERKTVVGRALQRAYERASLGGRGVLGKGLPEAGALQKPSLLRRHAPNVGLTAAGFGTAVLTTGTGPLGLVAGTAGLHAGFGGFKGIVSNLPTIQGVARRGLGRGLLHGVMPGLKDTRLLPKVQNAVGETLLTPALRDSERVMSSVGRTALDDVGGAINRRVARRSSHSTSLSHRFIPTAQQAHGAALATLGGGGLALAANTNNRG